MSAILSQCKLRFCSIKILTWIIQLSVISRTMYYRYNRLYAIKAYANSFTSDFMRTQEARFQVYVPLEESSRLPLLFTKVATHRMIPGRIFSHFPGVTLVEVVGTSGQNYDRFVEDCKRGGFDLRAVSNAEVEVTHCQYSLNPQTFLNLGYPFILSSGNHPQCGNGNNSAFEYFGFDKAAYPSKRKTRRGNRCYLSVWKF